MPEPFPMLHLIFDNFAAAEAYAIHRDKLKTIEDGHLFPELPKHFRKGRRGREPNCSPHWETLDKAPGQNLWRMRVPFADRKYEGHRDPETGHLFSLAAAVDDAHLPDPFKPSAVIGP